MSLVEGCQSDKRWSTAGQTAEYLALTRSITLNDTIARTIVDALELEKHEAEMRNAENELIAEALHRLKV